MDIYHDKILTMSTIKKHYYGWTIIAVGGVIIFFSGPGQTYSMSMFIDELVSTLNFSRSTISGYILSQPYLQDSLYQLLEESLIR